MQGNKNNLKALLLAAGFGTRLGSLTKSKPKCLMPIKGEPLLGIWIKKLENLGCQEIFINTHYLANQVEDYISSLKSNVTVNISYETKLLGTANTLMKHKNFFKKGDILLIHADNFTKLDLKAFLKDHKKRNRDCLLSMVTFETNYPKSCGIVSTNKDGIMINFEEKPLNPKSKIANGAIYAFNYKLFKYIEEIKLKNEVNDFSKDVLPFLKNKVNTFHTKDILIDIGTPTNLKLANEID